MALKNKQNPSKKGFVSDVVWIVEIITKSLKSVFVSERSVKGKFHTEDKNIGETEQKAVSCWVPYGYHDNCNV